MDHFEYQSGIYHAEDVSLATLANAVGTPFYCYSSATLTRHYQVFAEHFPGAKICFAVKANGNLAVLKTLGKLGCGADVVSEGEIRLAIAAGIAPTNIVFSGVGKTAEEMAFALSQNIFQFNIESEPELQLLNEVATTLGKKAPIAVRVNPDVDPKTHAKISLVTKRVEGKLRSYVHFGTGNYHPVTAKGYTDLSFFTCDQALCRDTAAMFNYMTGYATPERARAEIPHPTMVETMALLAQHYPPTIGKRHDFHHSEGTREQSKRCRWKRKRCFEHPQHSI